MKISQWEVYKIKSMQNVEKGRLLEVATKLYLKKESHGMVLTILYENPSFKIV